MYDDPIYYDLRTSATAADGRFWTRFASQTRGPILELGCGTGRVALPLARQGHAVVGLDLCHHMLNRAREKARKLGIRLHLLRADMRSFALAPRFDLVIIAYQSLHDLPELADWARCLQSAASVLSASGRLILDERDPPEPCEVPRLARRLRDPGGGVLEVYHRIVVGRNRVEGEITYRKEQDRQEMRFPFRGSWASDSQLLEMTGSAGLEVEEVFGGYDGRPKAGDHGIYLLRKT